MDLQTIREVSINMSLVLFQSTFTCSKLTTETVEHVIAGWVINSIGKHS